MKIGVTGDTSNPSELRKYEGWLLRFNPSIQFVELTHQRAQPADAENCSGLLLTGGGDIHPRAYGASEGATKLIDVDERRDDFEFKVFEKAMTGSIPLLGICRGLQAANVFLGGTLHLDLESDGFSRHTEGGGRENRHEITIVEGSMLGAMAGGRGGIVNSSHHQGIDRLGRDLAVSARSNDDVVEAVEWSVKKEEPFMLLVQWHPERMRDSSNPLAESVARTFLEETRKRENKTNQAAHQYYTKNYNS
jgi:putative glutamine amidotransferase